MTINPQLRRYRAQQAFERNVGKLRVLIHSDVPRLYLKPYLELLEYVLPDCGSSLQTNAYRDELAALKAAVESRPNLRLIK